MLLATERRYMGDTKRGREAAGENKRDWQDDRDVERELADEPEPEPEGEDDEE